MPGFINQKTQYALKAVFELALWQGKGPLKIAQIAKQQAIPQRFLEVILSQLKQGGFLVSKRGNEGGYKLTKAPAKINVLEIVEFMQGILTAVADEGKKASVFDKTWKEVDQGIDTTLLQTTFLDLLNRHQEMKEKTAPTYTI
jgi:Rrf2 family protein